MAAIFEGEKGKNRKIVNSKALRPLFFSGRKSLLLLLLLGLMRGQYGNDNSFHDWMGFCCILHVYMMLFIMIIGVNNWLSHRAYRYSIYIFAWLSPPPPHYPPPSRFVNRRRGQSVSCFLIVGMQTLKTKLNKLKIKKIDKSIKNKKHTGKKKISLCQAFVEERIGAHLSWLVGHHKERKKERKVRKTRDLSLEKQNDECSVHVALASCESALRAFTTLFLLDFWLWSLNH